MPFAVGLKAHIEEHGFIPRPWLPLCIDECISTLICCDVGFHSQIHRIDYMNCLQIQKVIVNSDLIQRQGMTYQVLNSGKEET